MFIIISHVKFSFTLVFAFIQSSFFDLSSSFSLFNNFVNEFFSLKYKHVSRPISLLKHTSYSIFKSVSDNASIRLGFVPPTECP